MIYNDIKTVNLKPEHLRLSNLEAAARLKVKLGYTDDLTEECKNELLRIMSPKFCYCESPVLVERDTCNFDFGGIKSEKLALNLAGCGKVFLIAATLGIEVDRYIKKCEVLSAAKGFVADGLASAFMEALCDYADLYLRAETDKPHRFSAGYGDLPLSYQKALVERLSASQTVGINLTESLLMVPQKSVTAILGVRDD